MYKNVKVPHSFIHSLCIYQLTSAASIQSSSSYLHPLKSKIIIFEETRNSICCQCWVTNLSCNDLLRVCSWNPKLASTGKMTVISAHQHCGFSGAFRRSALSPGYTDCQVIKPTADWAFSHASKVLQYERQTLSQEPISSFPVISIPLLKLQSNK